MSTEYANENCNGLPVHCVEQIALNKGGIACLDGRVARAETDIRERYTKEEADRMLDGKADRCALEKHLIDPCAHRRDCRPGGCVRPPICDCDCYSKEEMDTLLDKKVDVGPPVKYELGLASGFERVNAAEYWKDAQSLVTIHFKLQLADGADLIPGNHLVATLPEGFRPLTYVAHGVGYAEGSNADTGYVPIFILASGDLWIRIINKSDVVLCSISYYAV